MFLLKLTLVYLCFWVSTIECESEVMHRAQIVPISLNNDEQNSGPALEESLLEEEGSGQDIELAFELPKDIRAGERSSESAAGAEQSGSLASDRAEMEDLQRETIDKDRGERQSSSNQTKPFKDGCHSKVDLVFLLDTSGSIEQIYQEHVRWAVALVESLPIEQDTVRVAAVQYAGFPLTEFALGTYPNAEDIRQHLAQINFQSGVTRTGYALRKAEAELFRSDRGAREGAKKVIVLFTDGLSIDDPLKPAQQLRDLKGVVIYVVSVGNDGFELEMNRIAGSKDKVFGPEELPRLRDALILEAERASACIRIGSNKSSAFAAAKKPLQLVEAAASLENSLPLANFSLEDSVESETSPSFVEDILSLNEDNVVESTANLTQYRNSINGTKVTDPTTIETTKTPLTTTATPATSTKSRQTGHQGLENLVETDVFEDLNQSDTATRRVVTSRAPPSTNFKTKTKASTKRKTTTTTTTTTRPSSSIKRRLHFTVRPQSLVAANEPVVSVGVRKAIPFNTKINRVALPVAETSSKRLTTTTTRITARKITTATARITTSLTTTKKLAPTSTSKPRAFASVNRRISNGESCPIDWLFIIDSSGSVQSVYDEQKAYLGDILEQIQLGEQAHRVALLQFAGSEIQKTEWSYDAFEDNEALMNAFNQVRHITGTTYIGAALKSALHILESRRRQIPNIIVLLSDGFSQDDATKPAEELRKLSNSEFYALSISQLSNSQYLTDIAGKQENVFIGEKSEALRRVLIDRLQCRRVSSRK